MILTGLQKKPIFYFYKYDEKKTGMPLFNNHFQKYRVLKHENT